jgi:ABC-type sugar transport system permease subunit
LVVLAVVEFYPLLNGIELSITDASGNFSTANYAQMLSDSAFYTAIEVSVGYSLGSTGACILIGLALTFLVIQRVRGRSVF